VSLPNVLALVGPPGPTTNITIGTVTTGAPGSQASASITGTAPNLVLDLTIPEGNVGPSINLTIGTVTTGAPGSQASATITGTAPNLVLNLTIPQGPQGEQGEQGIQGAPGAGSVQISHVVTFGDSYGAMSYPGTGDIVYSTGPTYPALLSYALGLPTYGRYKTGWTFGTGWDNYAISGSVFWGTGDSATTASGAASQVNQFLADYGNAVPAGALILFQHTGINDVGSVTAGYGGMVTTADPLGTSWPAFTEPAINGTVTVAAPGGTIPTGLVANATPLQAVWIGGSLFSVTGIAGSNVTLTKLSALW
jgi:hypothetical protein